MDKESNNELIWKATIAVLVIAMFPLPVALYSLVRIVVFSCACYYAYKLFQKSYDSQAIVFAILAFIYNPIFQIYLYSKGLWIIIDIIAIIFIYKNKDKIIDKISKKNKDFSANQSSENRDHEKEDKSDFNMITIPYNEFDMAAITDKIKLFNKAGLRAHYDSKKREEGIVSIITQNPINMDGTLLIYEIHKVGKEKLIGKEVIWIIRLLTQEDQYSEKIEQAYCYGGRQVQAIVEADLQVQNNFPSILTWDQIIEAELG